VLEAAPSQSVASSRVAALGTDIAGKVQVQPLLEFASQGLGQMFYPEKNVFCDRLLHTPEGMVKVGISYRYTLMTLMGLFKAELAGFRSAIDIQGTLAILRKDTRWIDNGGDLGLFLWTCAMIAPQDLQQTIASFDLEKAFDKYSDTRERRTMELSWFLTGLSYAQLATQTGDPKVRDLAFKVFERIRVNQGASGGFGHLPGIGSLWGILRGRIGSFADQVYPIYAFSKFAEAFKCREALDRASRCADLICRSQGSLGQWWWHYDSVTGRVTGKHPVYSVHQEAMGPMALFALSEATGRDFNSSIFTGLDWIAGDNELGMDMRDPANHVIWRCLYQNKLRAYSNELLNFAGLPSSSTGLQVRFECRPYELGWLLYAFAGRQYR
jgi:hypothetical protein